MKLIDIADKNLIQSGIVKSLHKLQVPLWIDGENVIFEDGTVRKSPGNEAVCSGTDGTSINGLVAVEVDGNANLLAGDDTKLYRWNGSTLTTEASGFSGVVNHNAFQDDPMSAFQENFIQGGLANSNLIWSMENFGSWALATNGIDPIQIDKMDGGGASDISGSPTTAEILVRFGNHILAFNLSGTANDGITELESDFFAWCDIDDPENWITGAASFLPIREMGSGIKAACPLNDFVAAYSEDAMALVESLGTPYYFGAKKRLTGIGACSKHAVVPQGQYNYGMCKKGIWKTDGTSYQYVSPPFMRKWLEDNVNFEGFGFRVAGMLNEDRSLIEWGVPSKAGSGENDVTIGLNYDNDSSWTFRSYGITCGIGKGIFAFPIFGLSDGSILFGEIGVDADGEAQSAFVQTKPMLCNLDEDTVHWKTVDQIIVAIKDLEGSGTRIYIGVQENLDDAISWSSAMTPDEASAMTPVPEALDGKFISFKIESTGLGDDWTFSGLRIFGQDNGPEA